MTQQPTALPDDAGSPQAIDAELTHKGKKKDKKKGMKASAGIETMFRVTYQNHIALSGLADNKANMLVSINGLMTSVLVAGIAPRVAQLSWLVAPLIALITGCVASLVFAVLASKPRLNRRAITPEQARGNGGNLLFFGHFSNMSLADFTDSMQTLIGDQQLVRDSLVRQLYFMGEALEQKYKRLQIAYTAFLLGIGTASVLLVALLIADRGPA